MWEERGLQEINLEVKYKTLPQKISRKERTSRGKKFERRRIEREGAHKEGNLKVVVENPILKASREIKRHLNASSVTLNSLLNGAIRSNVSTRVQPSCVGKKLTVDRKEATLIIKNQSKRAIFSNSVPLCFFKGKLYLGQ